LLKELNPEQKQAVRHGSGPLLIIAGAGTGKTKVITQRIAFLLDKKLALPDEILALTFTDKAAEEMESRVDVLLPYGLVNTWISTFHAFGDRILREEAILAGLSPDFQLMSKTDQVLFFRDNIAKFKLKILKPVTNPTKNIEALIDIISRAKDENVSADEYLMYAKKLEQEAKSKEDEKEVLLQAEIASAYVTYEKLKKKQNVLDFSDQVYLTYHLLKDNPQILKKYQKQFKYVLVDEFQDTNYLQSELVKLLAKPQDNITVVGDDDQSIYKFRGASIANIMQFKKDYPKAKQVVLNNNYRSTQKILDSAYTGIRHNDPDRLEVKNQIDKKLISQTKVGKKPEFKVFDQIQAEADSIAQEIKKQTEKKKTTYSDIAILVRGNSYAQHFIQALNSANIPWVFSGASGLYQEPEVQLLTAFIKSVASNGDNLALYRLAESFIYQLNPNDLIECLDQARYSHNSLFWIMKQAKNNKRLNITEQGLETIEQIIKDLEQYRELAKEKTAGQILFQFLTEKKILELLTKRQTVKSDTQIKNIAEFFNRVKDFEQVVKQKTIQHLSEYLDSIIEAGESPEIEDFDPNLEAVSVLTVHAAKGLEFKTVFLPSLTHDRFPSFRRGKGLELPGIFIKEVLPKGDFHTQEERRLFYVAMTRAKENLNLSFSYNCGGQRKKRPSPFIGEVLGQEVIKKINQEKASAVEQIELFAQPKALEPKPAEQKLETVYLTSYKIDDYKTCPFKYKYVNVLHLPVIDNFQIVFGSAMHNTIQQFLTQKKAGKLLTLEQLLPIFYRYWRSKGFYSKGHELEAKEQAEKSLQNFITQEAKRTLPISIEESFSLKHKNSIIRGRWDAAYQTNQGLELIDFKSSDIPDPEKAKNRVRDSLQLDLYAWGYQEKYNKLPDKVGLYFLTSGNRVYRQPTDKTMVKIKKIVEKTSQGIIDQEFTPTPSAFACRYCSYSQICPYAIRK